MPYANPETRRQKQREYYLRKKVERQAYYKEWYEKNRDACVATMRKRYAANKEEYSAAGRQWHQENRARNCARMREYRKQNRDRLKESFRKYYSKNKHSYVEAALRRKRRLKERTPTWADLAAIREMYRLAQELTERTGESHHVDHVIPLRGELVSGLHVAENLRVVPAGVNLAKRNHFDVGTAERLPENPA